MLDLQHQYNNCTTTPHMRVDPSIIWGPTSCEGLLYSCCIGVVKESNPKHERNSPYFRRDKVEAFDQNKKVGSPCIQG